MGPARVPQASPGELCGKPTAGRHDPPGCERQHPPAPQQSRTHQEIPDQPRLLIPMRDKYGVSDDPHCWPGTSVLRNTLGIRDEATLADAEAEFARSEEHTSELQSLMRISYAVFCLKKKHKIHR